MRKPQTGKPYPAGLAARGDSAALRDALERSPTDLLDELRFIWDLPEGKPIRVIGRVWCKDLDGGGSIWLLDDIEHPATGIGLLYPPLPDALDTLGPRPAAAFVPPGRSREILDFHAVTSGGQWAIAELDLDSIKERQKKIRRESCRERGWKYGRYSVG